MQMVSLPPITYAIECLPITCTTTIHVSDFDLERYYRTIIVHDNEIVKIERHLTECGRCRDRLEEAGRYVRAVRIACGLDEHDRELY
jgi:hypothetical protein